MPESTITRKGQVTLPKPIRDHLGLHPGDRVSFVLGPEGRVYVEAATLDVENLRGRFKAERPVSIEQMKMAIRRRASEK